MRRRAILDFPQKVKFVRRASDQLILSCRHSVARKRHARRFLNCNWQFLQVALTILAGPWQHLTGRAELRRGERELKTSRTWIQATLLVVLIAALGVPPAALKAYARQQEGPVKPAPTPQPDAAPKQPSGPAAACAGRTDPAASAAGGHRGAIECGEY